MKDHTPGPWRWSDHVSPHITIYAGATEARPLMKLTEPFYRDGAGEAVANADLITAAPDLLAACKALVEYQESTDLDDEPEDGEYGDGKRALIAARAAIAKAEGVPS